MACKIPKAITDLKEKAKDFATELEGDILDKVKEIKGAADGLLTDLEKALPKLPELPDLQTELGKVMAMADSEITAGLATLKEKYGGVVPSMDEILADTFDFCSVPPVKEDGTVKADPPATPSAPPAASKPKPTQDKSISEIKESTAATSAERSFVHASSTMEMFVIERENEKIKEGVLTKEEAAKYRSRLILWYGTLLTKTIANETGVDIALVQEIFPGPILKDEFFVEWEKDPKKHFGGLISKFSDEFPLVLAKKYYDERFNISNIWGIKSKRTNFTFEEAVKFMTKYIYKIEE